MQGRLAMEVLPIHINLLLQHQCQRATKQLLVGLGHVEANHVVKRGSALIVERCGVGALIE